MTWSWNPAEISTTIALLAERWPKCFFLYERKRRPLKVGIDRDILAALDGVITPQELGCALRYYVGNRYYQLAMRAGAPRIDLEGNEVGTVTDEQANGAWAMLRDHEAKAARRRTEMKAKQAEAEAKKNAPKRLGLADLKAAALARKAACTA